MKTKFWLLVSLLLSGCASSSGVGEIEFKTWQEMQVENVVMQNQDYSCGAAALSTLLTYFFEDNVSEAAIISSIVSRSSEAQKEVIRNNGFSMTELRDEAIRLGYEAEIDTFPLDRIHKFPIPMIVYVEKHGFKHFAVLKGVRNGEAFLADPSRGNMQLHFDVFVEEWKNSTDSKDSYAGLALGKKGSMRTKDHPLEISDKMLLHQEYGAMRRALFNP